MKKLMIVGMVAVLLVVCAAAIYTQEGGRQQHAVANHPQAPLLLGDEQPAVRGHREGGGLDEPPLEQDGVVEPVGDPGLGPRPGRRREEKTQDSGKLSSGHNPES